MRRMRSPLIILMLVYFFSVLALVSVPGVDDSGQPFHMSALDAAYFIAIMQTTIGFGEIPYDFTDSQRLLVFLLLLPNVVAWLYSIGTLLGLILDKQFQAAFLRNRFGSHVNAIKEPFYIVCGFGNTGSMTVTGLLARGIRTVVIESEEKTVRRMMLKDRFAHVPAVVGRGRDRQLLELAGLYKENCMGVIATTNYDQVNLTIAITVKLLRPEISVLARSENQRVSDNMASFGTDAIIDPYRIFAGRVSLALSSPVKYLVEDWLISVPGSELRKVVEPPRGPWIVCGAGRFGGRMIKQLQKSGLPVTVVDVHPDRLPAYERAVLGRGTEEHTLEAAGIADAEGIVASTGDDIDNLSIIMTARHLNPRLFFIARQDERQHNELFDSSGADLVARRSRIVARQFLSAVTTPLLQSFMQHLRRSDEKFAERVAAKLKHVLQNRAPSIWVFELKGEIARNLRFVRARSSKVVLEHILRNSRSEENEFLPCVCLTLERGAQRKFLPDNEVELQIHDRLLFAGRDEARRQMLWTLQDSHSLMGNATGKHLPRGGLWRWLSER
ncbi:MAG: potassium channel protein [Xanthomonadales bacterium]|nr:potassium channel protein [Gammaproteobacteria bacterium]NNK04856.1 potassium channel protein [Xanthomonadales bacterium]